MFMLLKQQKRHTIDCAKQSKKTEYKILFRFFAAVHNIDGVEIPIYSDWADNAGGNSIVCGKNIANTVTTLQIDTFVKNNNIADIAAMKIDVEGNEMNLFKGARETIKRFCPVIHCEISPHALKDSGSSAVELFEYITGLYSCGAYILKGKKFMPVDVDYISKLKTNINCFFVPCKK
jgi:FkbM family methyltransferase